MLGVGQRGLSDTFAVTTLSDATTLRSISAKVLAVGSRAVGQLWSWICKVDQEQTPENHLMCI